MTPIYLMFTGLSLSGKTRLFKKIDEEFPKRFFPLDSRSIHDYLNQFEIFKDGNTVDGSSFVMRQEATDALQKELVGVITKHGFSIAHDSCNRLEKDRRERLEGVKKLIPGLKTVILYVNTPKEIVLERAIKEDQRLKSLGNPPAWEELYNKQVQTYEKPNNNESEYLIEFNGKNLDEVLNTLKDILS